MMFIEMSDVVEKLTRSIRYAFIGLWVAIIACAVAYYFSHSSQFTPANIAAFISAFPTEIGLVYFALSAARGFTLLPSTPFVLAGTLLFPSEPWFVLAITMAGILISSSLVYFCSDALGFAQYFETKKPTVTARIRRRLEHPSGLAFVALWAFFPIVPTDAVCYVAGSTKVNFPKFILAVFAGEFVLCSIYVFATSSVVKLLS